MSHNKRSTSNQLLYGDNNHHHHHNHHPQPSNISRKQDQSRNGSFSSSSTSSNSTSRNNSLEAMIHQRVMNFLNRNLQSLQSSQPTNTFAPSSISRSSHNLSNSNVSPLHWTAFFLELMCSEEIANSLHLARTSLTSPLNVANRCTEEKIDSIRSECESIINNSYALKQAKLSQKATLCIREKKPTSLSEHSPSTQELNRFHSPNHLKNTGILPNNFFPPAQSYFPQYNQQSLSSSLNHHSQKQQHRRSQSSSLSSSTPLAPAVSNIAQNEFESLVTLLKSSQNEVKQVEEKLTAAQDQMKQLQFECAQLRQNNSQYSHECTRLQQEFTESMSFKEQAIILKADLLYAQKDNANLKEEFEKRVEEIIRLQQVNAQLLAENSAQTLEFHRNIGELNQNHTNDIAALKEASARESQTLVMQIIAKHKAKVRFLKDQHANLMNSYQQNHAAIQQQDAEERDIYAQRIADIQGQLTLVADHYEQVIQNIKANAAVETEVNLKAQLLAQESTLQKEFNLQLTAQSAEIESLINQKKELHLKLQKQTQLSKSTAELQQLIQQQQQSQPSQQQQQQQQLSLEELVEKINLKLEANSENVLRVKQMISSRIFDEYHARLEKVSAQLAESVSRLESAEVQVKQKQLHLHTLKSKFKSILAQFGDINSIARAFETTSLKEIEQTKQFLESHANGIRTCVEGELTRSKNHLMHAAEELIESRLTQASQAHATQVEELIARFIAENNHLNDALTTQAQFAQTNEQTQREAVESLHTELFDLQNDLLTLRNAQQEQATNSELQRVQLLTIERELEFELKEKETLQTELTKCREELKKVKSEAKQKAKKQQKESSNGLKELNSMILASFKTLQQSSPSFSSSSYQQFQQQQYNHQQSNHQLFTQQDDVLQQSQKNQQQYHMQTQQQTSLRNSRIGQNSQSVMAPSQIMMRHDRHLSATTTTTTAAVSRRISPLKKEWDELDENVAEYIRQRKSQQEKEGLIPNLLVHTFGSTHSSIGGGTTGTSEMKFQSISRPYFFDSGVINNSSNQRRNQGKQSKLKESEEQSEQSDEVIIIESSEIEDKSSINNSNKNNQEKATTNSTTYHKVKGRDRLKSQPDYFLGGVFQNQLIQ